MSRVRAASVIEFSITHPWRVIAAALLITAGAVLPIRTIEVEPDVESLLPRSVTRAPETEKPEYSAEFDRLAVLVGGEDLFTLDGLNRFAGLVERLRSELNAADVIDPFGMITLEKAESRLRPVTMSPAGLVPVDDRGLADFRRRLDADPFSRGLISSRNGRGLAAYFLVPKGTPYLELDGRIRRIVSDSDGMQITFTGSIPFSAETERYLTQDSRSLLILVVVTILASYYLAFRSLRAMFLPAVVVVVGTLWSLAFMGLAGWKLSIVSIVSPPLVLTLGSSYSIHILSEYFAIPMTAESRNVNILRAVTGVSDTILMASLTTVAGLLCLLLASMQQTRQFAIATSVGVASTALLSLTLFPALLALQSPVTERRSTRAQANLLGQALARIGPAIVRRRWLAPAVMAALAAAFVILSPRVAFNTSPTRYFPDDERIIRELRDFSSQVGGLDELTITLTAPDGEEGYFLKSEVLAAVHDTELIIAAHDDVSHLMSLPAYLSFASKTALGREHDFSNRALNLLVSRMFLTAADSMPVSLSNGDFTEIATVVRVYNGAEQRPIDERDTRRIVKDIGGILDGNLPPDVRWTIDGLSLNFLELSGIMRRDFLVSTLAALAAIGVFCSVSFRSLRMGVLAIVPMVSGIAATFVLMAVFQIPLDMTTIMMSCVAIGVGVDDAIHFLLRHRAEQKLHPDDPGRTAAETLRHTGRPILLTTLSIVAGLAWFVLADFRPILYFGLLIDFTLSTTCLATLFLLPPLAGRRGLVPRKERP